MDYREALNYIESIGKFGMNFGLKRIKRMCELLGNPQHKLKIIHVGGTNGKGSTVTFISNILIKEGYKVGVYTSPHLERFTERIKINDVEISEEDVARLIEEIKEIIDIVIAEGYDHPTEFEIVTACAFKYFYEKAVDFVVLEVGLGGRLDATNVVDPIVSIITSISFDHMNILGDTIEKIASEKAGIIKEGKPLVLYPQDKGAKEVILKKADEMNSKVYLVEDVEYIIKSNTLDGIVFDVVIMDKFYKNLMIKMLNKYQVLNAITSLLTIEVLKSLGYKVSDISIYEGLKESTWPGRFEVINKDPYIVLDGGHNIQGIKELKNGIKEYFGGKKVKIVFGVLKDKDYISMVDELIEVCNDFITVTPVSPRALDAEELKEFIKNKGKNAKAFNDIDNAIEHVLNDKDCDVVVFCGSLYMIGKIRSKLKHMLA
ncbi:bifunctional folylpolyglutamate synthase/dihydrofolate synthase [Thermobrachium celere]|uniref:Dihydrofolate synthase/folylpolyglutamate synthase n=1 Tax=Thermobrachium celere DSM 8682 TaxID=941824 RepID=R7RTF1_9CLOT|nr:folylpolyglutamate synthase/dihydrofolate synthase family protein [Thermobrachium celere]CDF58505.1 Dihydrofolate synthase / Folylpolyglutamate synthase [Thermobrachium celere DSM 8682]